MELSNQQKRDILKAIQSGKCSPEDITPAKTLTAFKHEDDRFFEINGEPFTNERMEMISLEMEQANSIRKEIGLPLHSITYIHFVNYGEE